MQDDNSNNKSGQPEENQDENLKDNEISNDDSVNNEGIKDQGEENTESGQPPQSNGEDMPVEDKTTTIDIKKDKHIGEEEKKSNKKIFVIAGIAIMLAILLIAILLLFLFCKNNDIPDNGAAATTAVEQTIDNSGNNNSDSSSSTSSVSSDVAEETEETPETVEETTAAEVIEETPETEATAESTIVKPTISLAIIEGPIYSSADDVCFYRVRATVTGIHDPVVWSKNDTASYGPYVAQVNLTRANPTYTLTGTVTNSAGSASESIPLSWGCNSPPDVTAINIASEVTAGSSNSATAIATDPDGDAISYNWAVNGGSLSNAAINPTDWTVPAAAGSYQITVTVSDGKGGTDSMSKNITVVAQNRPPEVSDIYVKDHNTQASASYAVTGFEYDLSVNASDPDGDTLDFSWSLSGSINPGSLSNSGSNPASWTAPYSTAWVTITVVVDDGNGGTVTRTRSIEVRYGLY
jgi:flagellar basal body-associated protein FliL